MGGDNSPEKTIEGVGIFIKNNKNNKDFKINLFGNIDEINKSINKFGIDKKNIEIKHTISVISDDETPLTAIKNSKNTSMWNCIKSQIDGERYKLISRKYWSAASYFKNDIEND